jgi:Caspase domain
MGVSASIPEPKAKAVVKPLVTNYAANVKDFTEKRVRSVIIGINYSRTDCSLHGCINDAQSFYNFLTDRTSKNPEKSSIVFLRDDVNPQSLYYPSKDNILRALTWVYSNATVEDFEKFDQDFTKKSPDGTVVVFYYSGHGSQVYDVNGDEQDGYDETLCPVTKSGDFDDFITDDELRSLVSDKVSSGVYSIFLTDCCHSGTVLDLEYVYSGGKFTRKGDYRDTNGIIIHFGACYDRQTALEGPVCGKSQGYFTYSFVNAFRKNTKYDIGTLYRLVSNSMVQLVSQREEMPQLSAGCPVSMTSRIPL